MALFSRKGKPVFAMRDFAFFVRRRLHVHRRQVTLLLLFLLLLTPPILCWVCFSFYYDYGLDYTVAPPLAVPVFPFRDLCEVALRGAPHNATAAASSPLQQHRLQARVEQLAHIPADGGAAGVRWSTATGLPLPAHRTSRTVAAHFVTLSTRTDDVLQAATTAATMAGVPLEVVGVGWMWFAFTRRMEILRSFLDLENVSEDDVLISVDADALFSGADVYDAVTAFVASTAASAAEHATYAVRDIRLGRRQPPVLFAAESNCMHAQAYPSRHLCRTGYDTIDAMMASWSQQAGQPLPSSHRGTNPFRYLNAGVVVGRVWAVRQVWAAARAFMDTHAFYAGDEWWCDQSVLGSLYLQLRWWEVESGALDAATPRTLSNKTRAACLFPPLVLPEDHRGPHGLPGGLVGLDDVGRFSAIITTQVAVQGVLRVGGTATTTTVSPEQALVQHLQTRGHVVEEGLLTLPQSAHRLELAPRRGYDCGTEAEAEAVAEAVSRPPECAYRAAVLGMPDTVTAVAPLIWHFAGKFKRHVLTSFRGLFPWYTPMLWNATVRSAVLATLSAAPPTRLWYLNATTDLPFENVVHALYPHHQDDDVSFTKLCALSNVRA